MTPVFQFLSPIPLAGYVVEFEMVLFFSFRHLRIYSICSWCFAIIELADDTSSSFTVMSAMWISSSIFSLYYVCKDWGSGQFNTLWRCPRHPWNSIIMTSQWAGWRLKSSASRLFTQPFIRAQIKESIKAPRHWPLCWELPVNSPHKWPVTRKLFPFDDVIMPWLGDMSSLFSLRR